MRYSPHWHQKPSWGLPSREVRHFFQLRHHSADFLLVSAHLSLFVRVSCPRGIKNTRPCCLYIIRYKDGWFYFIFQSSGRNLKIHVSSRVLENGGCDIHGEVYSCVTGEKFAAIGSSLVLHQFHVFEVKFIENFAVIAKYLYQNLHIVLLLLVQDGIECESSFFLPLCRHRDLLWRNILLDWG